MKFNAVSMLEMFGLSSMEFFCGKIDIEDVTFQVVATLSGRPRSEVTRASIEAENWEEIQRIIKQNNDDATCALTCGRDLMTEIAALSVDLGVDLTSPDIRGK